MSNLPTFDGLENVYTGLGTARDKRTHNTWAFETFQNWRQLDAAYQSNWIARQVVDVPANDMLRVWREFKCVDAEDISQYEAELGVECAVQEAYTWSRLYGGGLVLMVTDQPLDQPLDVNRIGKGSLKRLIPLDRHDVAVMLMNTTDILAENYLRPQIMTIVGGMQPIHHSHFVMFRGELVPRRYLQATQGWGDSVLRKCLSDIADLVAAKNGIAGLMQEANLDVIKSEGLSDALGSDQDDAITKRYQLYGMMKSVVNLSLLDKDKEELERHTLNLSGVAPVFEQMMTWISGSARIPVTKLFGTSAKGMNATGEGDLQNYYDDLSGTRKLQVERPLRKLDEVLVRSALGAFPEDFDYQWNPLDMPSVTERAQAELLIAQRDAQYMDAGIVTRAQVMRNLMSKEVYPITDEDVEEAEREDEAEEAFSREDLTFAPDPYAGMPNA